MRLIRLSGRIFFNFTIFFSLSPCLLSRVFARYSTFQFFLYPHRGVSDAPFLCVVIRFRWIFFFFSVHSRCVLLKCFFFSRTFVGVQQPHRTKLRCVRRGPMRLHVTPLFFSQDEAGRERLSVILSNFFFRCTVTKGLLYFFVNFLFFCGYRVFASAGMYLKPSLFVHLWAYYYCLFL